MFDFIMYDIIGSIVFATMFAVCGCMITELFFWMFPSKEIEKDIFNQLKAKYLNRPCEDIDKFRKDLELFLKSNKMNEYHVHTLYNIVDQHTCIEIFGNAGGKIEFFIQEENHMIDEIEVCYVD